MSLRVLSTMNWERHLAGWLSPSHALVIFFVVATFFAMTASYSRRIYRLYWHPLSKFPGPEEAAKTDRWLYHQELSAFPEATFEDLHRQYGAKAIRIAPNELHINDTSLYKAIYKQSNPFPKHRKFYDAFGTSTPTSFTVVDRQKHKERRRMLNNMFSRAGVLKLEDLICACLKLLENKIDRLSEKDLDFYNAFRVLTTTIILEFCFGDSGNMIEEDPHGFNSKFLEAFNVTAGSVATFRYHPWMRVVLGKIPNGVTRVLNPGVASLLDVMEFTRTCIRRWRRAHEKENDVGHRLVLDNLQSLSDDDLLSESINLLVAGSDTSATSLTIAVLEILSHPEMHKRLVEELEAAIPDKNHLPTVQTLEGLPFLTACVKEGIRFTTAVPGRLPRVVPSESTPFIVDGKVVPPGTIVSVSAHTMHTSCDLWGPDARYFNPDRWLVADAKRLEEYQVAFGKGSRMCLGVNLVPVEMTIVLASIFRKYSLNLPPGFVPPQRVDKFTLEMRGGLVLKASRRK